LLSVKFSLQRFRFFLSHRRLNSAVEKMTSLNDAPPPPTNTPKENKENKRARLIADMRAMNQATSDGQPDIGEAGARVASSASGSHPMFITSMMLKMALFASAFMSVLSAVATLLSADRTTANVTMFALSLVIAFGVLEIFTKTLIEEALFLFRAANSGNKRAASTNLLVAKFSFQLTIVIQLMAVIVDVRDGPMSTGFVIVVAACVTLLILVSIVFIWQTESGYLIRDQVND
jgi:hypothetical protein